MSGGYPNQQYPQMGTPQMQGTPFSQGPRPQGAMHSQQTAGLPPPQYNPEPKPGYPAQKVPAQDAYGGGQKVPAQDAYGGAQQLPPQGTYGGAQQFPPQGAYGGAQQFPPQGAYGGAQQFPPQGAYGGAQQGQFPMGQWTTGLCDCGDDLLSFCIACCCTCVTFGQVAEVIDQGATSCILAGAGWLAMAFFTGCPCIISCLWRRKLRAKYNLPDDEVGDFCIHCWCEPCALAQEYRELKNRGLDPSLGWGFLSQQGHGGQPMGIPMQAPMQR